MSQEENLYPVTQTIQQVMEENGITSEVKQVTEGFEKGEADEHDPKRTHWVATFTKGKKSFTLDMGLGIKRDPTTDEILSQYLQDIQSIVGYTFEDWAPNFGYDPDSRKAEKIFESIKSTRSKIINALGEQVYLKLLEAD